MIINGKWSQANEEQANNRMNRIPVRWTVRWSFNDREYMQGYEFHHSAIAKQLALQEIGIESIIECAR